MDSDDAPRFVLTVRLMFSDMGDAQSVARDIEETTGGTLASEYAIEEV